MDIDRAQETAFRVPVGGGVLAGHRGGEGPPALVLHGGARPETFPQADANLRRGLEPEVVARLDEIEALRRDGHVSEAELVERFRIVRPQYFADGASAPEPPEIRRIVGEFLATET